MGDLSIYQPEFWTVVGCSCDHVGGFAVHKRERGDLGTEHKEHQAQKQVEFHSSSRTQSCVMCSVRAVKHSANEVHKHQDGNDTMIPSLESRSRPARGDLYV